MKAALKFIAFLSLTALCTQQASAQVKKMQYRDRLGDSVTIINTQEKAARQKAIPPLRREHAIGLRLHTDGWGLHYRYGIIKNNEGRRDEIDRFYNVLFIELEASERYHPKEYRDYAGGVGQPYRNFLMSMFSTDMYKFGKINNIYTAKLGMGYKYLLAGKPEARTISLHWVNTGGLSMALVKPYYFGVDGGEMIALDPEAEDLANVLAQTRFSRGYGFREGWSELKVVPGVYLRSGLNLDYAQKRKNVSALEIGIGTDLYFQKIYQLAFHDPKAVFFNAYLSVSFGWKR